MLKSDLKGWNKDVFGHTDKIKLDIVKKIQELDMRDDEDGLDENRIMERKDLLNQLQVINTRNESLLQQKSRALWIKQGDSNSKFFHASIKWRRMRNGIKGVLCQNSGSWVEEPNTVKEMVKEFYKNKMIVVDDIGVRLDNVEFKKLFDHDNNFLTEPFDGKEIKEAIWNCDSHKSPGPDGITFSFIKNNWGLLEKDVEGVVNCFYREGKIPKGCNASFLTLIPKIENPQSLEEYRPISLVSCVYKFLTKLLANRIKKVIGKVVDGTQSAFLSNRGLLDSVLVVNEVIDELKRRKKSGVVVKLDFEKAYDSVSWEFLFYIMRILGFCEKWIQWIRACLESASVSVLVNGSPTKEFKPSRGLRQGDPMTPFLFLIVAQGLAGLVNEAIRKNLLSGIKVGGKKVDVNLLQFDDNTLFVCESKVQNIICIKAILRCFELSSGLRVNYHKSKIGAIGGNPSRCSFWKHVLLKVRKKLSV